MIKLPCYYHGEFETLLRAEASYKTGPNDENTLILYRNTFEGKECRLYQNSFVVLIQPIK